VKFFEKTSISKEKLLTSIQSRFKTITTGIGDTPLTNKTKRQLWNINVLAGSQKGKLAKKTKHQGMSSASAMNLEKRFLDNREKQDLALKYRNKL
jgi:hypothetical protein